MQANGIDVSKHNGNINWQSIKNTKRVDFVILRAGYGSSISQKDAKFEQNYQQAKAQGIPVGAYWYSYALTPAAAKKEAGVFLQAIYGKQFEYPVYLDIEEASQFKLGKDKVTEIVKAFCETVEAAGYFVGIYSSKSGLSYINPSVRDKYTVWVAHVNVQKTTYTGPHDMWQYSWKGRYDGAVGDVDQDYCYKDFPTIIKNAGKNGFEKKGAATSTKGESVASKTSESAKTNTTPTKKFNVKVVCYALNVRSGPGLSYKKTTIVHQNEIYSIVEEKNGWGKLISGAGWINIDPKYVKRV